MNTFVKNKVYSWEIISETEAIKTVDKSVLISRESGIPKEIKYFFEVEHLSYKKKLDIKIEVDEKLFGGNIKIDNLGRAKIFFGGVLGNKIEKNFLIDRKKNIETYLEENVYKLKFIKMNKFLYKLNFFTEKQDMIKSKTTLSLPNEDEVKLKEGDISYSINKIYERNIKNREVALKIHGTDCCICGFNFEKVYGDLGKDYIEIHHKIPLSSLEESITINPRTDLVPVCANCHRMIHRNKTAWKSIDAMKSLFK